ncbi:unnamed protein product [Moneuplotes crassus]|uniref:Uncharacterized protein n=1 Tax=Euplotes crassus TaxID=5936 RepID=A0AAD2D3W4_EUPCR|nr:unnamed protein product [Moneuplotes crassus]
MMILHLWNCTLEELPQAIRTLPKSLWDTLKFLIRICPVTKGKSLAMFLA